VFSDPPKHEKSTFDIMTFQCVEQPWQTVIEALGPFKPVAARNAPLERTDLEILLDIYSKKMRNDAL
jgi:hypothetical protein